MSFQSSKHEYHALKMVVLKDNLFSEEVEAHTWTDNAPVMVLSAVHEPGSKAVKSEGNERVKEAFGDAEKDMRIPPCINDYNQHMSGAGIAFSYWMLNGQCHQFLFHLPGHASDPSYDA